MSKKIKHNKNNELPAKSGRNPDGTFAVGHAPVNGAVHYRYGQRAEQLQKELTTEEILALAADDKKLAKRPAIDTIVIRRLARAMKHIEPTTAAEVERAAELHLDRTEGATDRPNDSPIRELSMLELAKWMCFIIAQGSREQEQALEIDHE